MKKLVTKVGSFAPLFDRHVPHLLEKIFFFLDYDSLTKCSEVCLVWAKLFNSTLYQNKLRRKYLAPWTTLKMILDRTREDTWSWDWVLGVSYMIRLSGAELRQVSFHDPYSEGTAGMRGTRKLNNGRYFWEIHVSDKIWDNCTSLMFGIGKKSVRLEAKYQYKHLLGENADSWGLSHRGTLHHANVSRVYTEKFATGRPTTIGLYFDGIDGKLIYYKDGVSLGVAFDGLNNIEEPLYPIICSTGRCTKMTLGVRRREIDFKLH